MPLPCSAMPQLFYSYPFHRLCYLVYSQHFLCYSPPGRALQNHSFASHVLAVPMLFQSTHCHCSAILCLSFAFLRIAYPLRLQSGLFNSYASAIPILSNPTLNPSIPCLAFPLLCGTVQFNAAALRRVANLFSSLARLYTSSLLPRQLRSGSQPFHTTAFRF